MSEPTRDQFDAAGDAVGRPRYSIERRRPRLPPVSADARVTVRSCLLLVLVFVAAWLAVGLFAVSVVLLVLGILGWIGAR